MAQLMETMTLLKDAESAKRMVTRYIVGFTRSFFCF